MQGCSRVPFSVLTVMSFLDFVDLDASDPPEERSSLSATAPSSSSSASSSSSFISDIAPAISLAQCAALLSSGSLGRLSNSEQQESDTPGVDMSNKALTRALLQIAQAALAAGGHGQAGERG